MFTRFVLENEFKVVVWTQLPLSVNQMLQTILSSNRPSEKILRLQNCWDGLSLAGSERKVWPGMQRVGDIRRINAKLNFRF